MKKLFLSLVCVTGLLLTSCGTESTGNVSTITVFPEISIIGNSTLFSIVGQPFDDPGANATIGGASVDFTTTSDIDTSTAGIYNVQYTAINSDGFEAAASRTVIIYEDSDPIAGVYDGIRNNRGFGGLVLISTRSDGNYNVTDFLAGYYAQGLGYGPNYNFPGIISENAGTIANVTLGQGGFGPVSIQNGTADTSSEATVLAWFGQLDDYAPFGFDVTFTKRVSP